MAFFDWLFGCSDRKRDGRTSSDRFVSAESFEQNLTRQTAMSPEVLVEVRQLGISSDSALKLEYFFYTDVESKATALASELEALGYSAQSGEAAGDEELFLITGWTSPIGMSERDVVAWTEQMVRLGYKHDAEFDGWGTTPEQ